MKRNCGYEGESTWVSTGCHGGTDCYDVEICPWCHVPIEEREDG